MYYMKVEENQIVETEEAIFMKSEDTVGLFSLSEWERADGLREKYDIRLEMSEILLCKLENYQGYLYATIRIPPKWENEVSQSFAFYLLPEKLILIDNSHVVMRQFVKICQKKLRKGYNLERFLYDFLTVFLEEDLLFLQEIEKKIAAIEEDVLKHCCPEFNIKMLYLKKKIAQFYRYYSQLTEIGQELTENEMDFFGQEELRMFDQFCDRARRLAAETQLLREYAMQVQDVYQSEIGIRQNAVMKMLTVVTTIFLPLTLIVGWYGMNFRYMPELEMKYAYPAVAGVSLLIVILSLIIFKKKRYW